MGDTEQVQMDGTPIFPPVRGAPVRRRRQLEGDLHAQKEVGESGDAPKPGLPKYLRFALLLSIIPIMFYTPKVLIFFGDKVQKNQHLLIYLWSVSL
jgi:hypothetical protein